MPAVYTRQKTGFGGSFASDSAAMTLAGSLTPLGIIQNAQLTYAQNVSRIYDVGNGGQVNKVPVYFVGGRTQGSATIARVLGPDSGALCAFYEAIGNVCSPQDLTFTFGGGCGGGGGPGARPTARIPNSNAVGAANFNSVKYTAEACVMTQMGVQVQSENMIVNENINIMFANLNCEAN